MGLDVGAVQIKYLARPVKVAYDFLWHLSLNADEADWNTSAPGNVFVEYLRENMLEQLDDYVAMNSISQSDVAVIRGWIARLPWRDDVVMLHLSS